MTLLKSSALAITFGLMAATANAFPVTVGYEGTVVNVEGDSNPFWDYSIGDAISGVFNFDTDETDGPLAEFIDSTHAPAGPGIDFIQDAFGPDEVLADEVGGDAEIEIFNIGGFIDEELENGAVLAEGIVALFDADFFFAFVDGESIWLDGEDVEGFGFLAALFGMEESGGDSFVDFDITALHLETGTTSLVEPGTLGLLGLGLLGIFLVRRRQPDLHIRIR